MLQPGKVPAAAGGAACRHGGRAGLIRVNVNWNRVPSFSRRRRRPRGASSDLEALLAIRLPFQNASTFKAPQCSCVSHSCRWRG